MNQKVTFMSLPPPAPGNELVFGVSKIEQQSAEKRMAKHRSKRAEKGELASVHNIRHWILSRPSGIGVSVECVCSCSKKKDVTDCDSW